MNPDTISDFLRKTFLENPPIFVSFEVERNVFYKTIQTARGFIIAQKENPAEYSEKQLLSDLEALFFEKQVTGLMK